MREIVKDDDYYDKLAFWYDLSKRADADPAFLGDLNRELTDAVVGRFIQRYDV